jgi:hypothetical protein
MRQMMSSLNEMSLMMTMKVLKKKNKRRKMMEIENSAMIVKRMILMISNCLVNKKMTNRVMTSRRGILDQIKKKRGELRNTKSKTARIAIFLSLVNPYHLIRIFCQRSMKTRAMTTQQLRSMKKM